MEVRWIQRDQGGWYVSGLGVLAGEGSVGWLSQAELVAIAATSARVTIAVVARRLKIGGSILYSREAGGGQRLVGIIQKR